VFSGSVHLRRQNIRILCFPGVSQDLGIFPLRRRDFQGPVWNFQQESWYFLVVKNHNLVLQYSTGKSLYLESWYVMLVKYQGPGIYVDKISTRFSVYLEGKKFRVLVYIVGKTPESW
jgi:hypothetical protein